MLSISNSLIAAVINSLNNPLSSDMTIALAAQTNNYNDLFDTLPNSVCESN